MTDCNFGVIGSRDGLQLWCHGATYATFRGIPHRHPSHACARHVVNTRLSPTGHTQPLAGIPFIKPAVKGQHSVRHAGLGTGEKSTRGTDNPRPQGWQSRRRYGYRWVRAGARTRAREAPVDKLRHEESQRDNLGTTRPDMSPCHRSKGHAHHLSGAHWFGRARCAIGLPGVVRRWLG